MNEYPPNRGPVLKDTSSLLWLSTTDTFLLSLLLCLLPHHLEKTAVLESDCRPWRTHFRHSSPKNGESEVTHSRRDGVIEWRVPMPRDTHWESQMTQQRHSVCFPSVLALGVRGLVYPEQSVLLRTSADAKMIGPFLFLALGALSL